MHWDRLVILIALVSVLTFVLMHAIAHLGGNGASVAADGSVLSNRDDPLTRLHSVCPQPTTHLIRAAPRRGSAPTVALTFDDGPGRWTPKVLQILREEHVHASFFVIGRQARAQPAIVRQMVLEGHALGDHTWSHDTPSTQEGWRARTLEIEIARTQRRLNVLTGRKPCMFRPPGGVVKGARQVSRAAHLSIVLWSVDTRDWSSRHERDAALISKQARRGLQQRHPVILLHDGGGYRAATVAALKEIIHDYRKHGYRFVTLDQGR